MRIFNRLQSTPRMPRHFWIIISFAFFGTSAEAQYCAKVKSDMEESAFDAPTMVNCILELETKIGALKLGMATNATSIDNQRTVAESSEARLEEKLESKIQEKVLEAVSTEIKKSNLFDSQAGIFSINRRSYPDLLDNTTCLSGNRGHRGAKNVTVSFPRPFKTAPTVSLGLASIDHYKEANLRILARASNITKNSFDVSMTTYCDTRISSASIYWLAIGKPES